MKLVIRADASDTIGSGHVMRGLTLADALRQRGHEVRFVCRELRGDLIALIHACGFTVAALPALGDASLESDARQTLAAIDGRADWVVVDHYGLDAQWERDVRAACDKVMAIDDVANRAHDCDLLLDQNLSLRPPDRYARLLARPARQLLGPSWALVRPEFAALRATSLNRRVSPEPRRLVVFMGGGDVLREVRMAVQGALASDVPWTGIDVVVGRGCPGQELIARQLADTPGALLHVQTGDMARLMCDADLALTAAGSVSWEKCCLGLPSIVVVLADNQADTAAALHASGAAVSLGRSVDLHARSSIDALESLGSDALHAMSMAASRICDGEGAVRVAAELEQELGA